MPDDQGAPPTRVAAPVNAGPTPQQVATSQGAAKKKAGRTRARLFSLLAFVIVVAAVGWIAYYLLIGSHYVSTDDAYVGADVAQITPQIPGQVAEVLVNDTQAVKKGDVLVRIDPADQNLVVAQARADYGRAIRRIRQDLGNNQAAAAQITARDADMARADAQLVSAKSDLERARIDLQRREALSKSGAVSGEELTTARNAFQTAQANLTATQAAGAQVAANKTVAQGQLAAANALTEGADVDSNPEVQAAKAALDTALLNQSRAVIRAPFDGVIAQRQVEVGQRVPIGAELMTLVPVSKVYVNANFKEVQLRKVLVGQPVTLTADRYGHGVVYHGRVVGLSGGTGSAFAVIPAQNATGNWIKVVQRLPVRISLDPQELARYPLRVGLSMSTRIDVGAPGDTGRSVESTSAETTTTPTTTSTHAKTVVTSGSARP
ncbi:MAG: HlyD family efflux transporter periplasmic adaptor subunit [Caulobacteraceae bacterium]